MKNINDRFLEAMQFVGITGYYVAKSAGVSEGTLSNVKSGKNKPSTDLLEWILNNYEAISAEYLMRGRGSIDGKTSVVESKVDKMLMEMGEMKQYVMREKLNFSKNPTSPILSPKASPKSKSKE